MRTLTCMREPSEETPGQTQDTTVSDGAGYFPDVPMSGLMDVRSSRVSCKFPRKLEALSLRLLLFFLVIQGSRGPCPWVPMAAEHRESMKGRPCPFAGDTPWRCPLVLCRGRAGWAIQG